MKLPIRLVNWIRDKLIERVMLERGPDFIIGGEDDPYLLRWWVIPRNRFFNVYLHRFLRSDDDRALHSHMYVNCSVLLQGAYTEHTIAAGGIHNRAIRAMGAVVCRLPSSFHRVELHDGPALTLFITGPRVREWGFACAEAGFVPWHKFVDTKDAGSVGKGCNQ